MTILSGMSTQEQMEDNLETIIIDGGMNKRMIYHGDWNWEYHKN